MVIPILLSLYLGLLIRSLVAFLGAISIVNIIAAHLSQRINFRDLDYANSRILWIVTLGLIGALLIGNKGKSMILWWALTLVLLASFTTRKLFLFYVVFELRLVPILLMILFFGTQPERLSAGLYFVIYTMVLSLPFIGSVLLVLPQQCFVIKTKMGVSLILSVLLIAPFLVKIPVLGVHFWLPKAHVEARTRGSIILAGLLLKLGSYGVVRILYLFPPIRKGWLLFPWLLGATISRVITLTQSDIKKFIAYSRVAHMTFIIVGAVRGCKVILISVIIISLAHSWASMGIFSRAGSISRGSLSRLGNLLGMESSLHWMTFSIGLILVINASVPPMLSFFPEVIILIRVVSASPLLLPTFVMLRLIVCYYNAYFFVLLLNTKESFSSNRIRLTDCNRIILIIIARAISLVWLANC